MNLEIEKVRFTGAPPVYVVSCERVLGFFHRLQRGGVGLLVREALVSQRVLGKLDNRLAVNDGTACFKTVVILMNVI